MSDLRQVLLNDSYLSNRNIRQLISVFNSNVEKDPEKTLFDLLDLLCGERSVLFPTKFLQYCYRVFESKNIGAKFGSLFDDGINTSFWNNKTSPNISSFTNYFNLNSSDYEKIFKNNELRFIEIISLNITQFSSFSFKSLPRIMDSFLTYLTKSNISFSENTLSSYESYFDHSIKSIFLTSLIKIFDNEDFSESHSVILTVSEYLTSIYSTDDIINRNSDVYSFLCEKIPEHILLFISAEIIRHKPDIDKAMIIHRDANSLIHMSNLPKVLINCYNTISFIITIIDDLSPILDDCSFYFLRDFDASNPIIKSSLCNLFDSLIKRAVFLGVSSNVSEFFTIMLSDVPWNTKLKKYMMPTILQYVSPKNIGQTLRTMIEASKIHENRQFIGKCITSFTKNKQICLKFLDILIDEIRNLSFTDPIPNNRFFFTTILGDNSGLVKTFVDAIENVQEVYPKIILRMNLYSSIPTTYKEFYSDDTVVSDICYGLRSGNWDLRTTSLTVYVECGFPHSDSDINMFLNEFENILLIDSSYHQCIISDVLNSLFKRLLVQQKKHSHIDILGFLGKILELSSENMSPLSSPGYRQFSLNICSSLWNLFPNIGSTRQFLLVASLVKDNNEELKKESLKILKKLKCNECFIDTIKSLNASDVNYFVLLDNVDTLRRPLTSFNFEEFTLSNYKKIENILSENNTEFRDYSRAISLKQYLEHHNDLDWELRKEIFNVISLICYKNASSMIKEDIVDITNYFFNVLFDTREVGLVCSSIEAFERLLTLLHSLGLSSVVEGYSDVIISQLSVFDMKQMRRSACLPFLSKAIMKTEPSDLKLNLFAKLARALIMLIKNSDSSMEATNAMNILNIVTIESELSQKVVPLLPEIFESIFESVYRFSTWDLLSAADITIVSFLRKMCSHSSSSSSLTTPMMGLYFFKKISNSRSVLIKALGSKNQHAIFLAMIVIQLLNHNSGDKELADLLKMHLRSPISRVRRVAARCLVNVICSSERINFLNEIVSTLNSKNIKKEGWNYFHGACLAFKEIGKLCQNVSVKIPVIPLSFIPSIAQVDYINCLQICNMSTEKCVVPDSIFKYNQGYTMSVLGVFKSDLPASTLLSLLMNWKDSLTVPNHMLNILLERVMEEKELSGNEALSIAILSFLSKHLQKDCIKPDRFSVIVSLALKTHSIQLSSSLFLLIKFVNSPNIEELVQHIPNLIEVCLDYSSKMTPLHISLSSISHLLFGDTRFYPILLLLLINDVPLVRTNILKAYQITFISDFESEYHVLTFIVSKIDEQMKKYISDLWIERVKLHSEYDRWDETFSLFVSEAFIPCILDEHYRQKYNTIDLCCTTSELRKKLFNL